MEYIIETEGGFKFMVIADDKSIAVEKVKDYIPTLYNKDGYTTMAIKSLENINNGDYTITESEYILVK